MGLGGKVFRVVVTLTTMPDKYPKLLQAVKSLRNQTYPIDAIYLTLPEKSERLGITYPPISQELSEICTVVPSKDYGPITKIVGALLMEDDLDTVIITADDDILYPEDMVSKLVALHKRFPNTAIGSSGMLLKYPCPMCAIYPNQNTFVHKIPRFHISSEGRRVDSIYGYPGALYVRKFFPKRENLEGSFLHWALKTPEMFMNDDIVISGYLSLKGIERRIFTGLPEVKDIIDAGKTERTQSWSEISYNMDFFFQRLNSAISSSKKEGMYATTESMDMAESIFGIGAILIVAILIIIGIIVYLFINKWF
jgi:hypothetical protein